MHCSTQLLRHKHQVLRQLPTVYQLSSNSFSTHWAYCTTKAAAHSNPASSLQCPPQPVPVLMDEGDSTQEGAEMRHKASEVSEQAAENHANDEPQPQKKVKRNVAMHVGYVGTNYTGLQANRQLVDLVTIEGVLEQAIFKAGLISEANFGDFRKTKWSRSSRTDKGVHSLATVIALRILMHEEDYDTDCEGIRYAQAINKHLPEDVCVFAVQRTNKSFNARRWCATRTYEYYLPAYVLGLNTPDGSSSEDQRKLQLLRDVLDAYCGYKPFHNYAGNRSQYVGQKAKAQQRKARREAARAAAEATSDVASSTDADVVSSSDQQDAAVASSTAAPGPPAAAKQRKSAVCDEDEESDAEVTAEAALYAAAVADFTGEGPVPPELQWRQQVKFLNGPDPDDPVVKSHYRLMRHFTADDPKPLVPGGVSCLRLEVCGDSFMLHQIRHMVGMAVAVVRGILPRELLDVSLSAPGRVTPPRAPPHSLLLYGSQFAPFPAGWGLDTPVVARYTGDRLELREQGQGLRQDFRRRVFNAAINQLLLHPDWEVWSERFLPRYLYAPEDVQQAVEQYKTWDEEVKARRAAKAAEKAAAEEAALVEKEAAAVAEVQNTSLG